MCGRYRIGGEEEVFSMVKALSAFSLGKESDRAALRASFECSPPEGEAYPSCRAPLILPSGVISARWGFAAPGGKGIIFNTRSEGMAQNRFFSRYYKSGRCIVPAAAYFEWRKNGKEKPVKYVFTGGSMLLMAGLYRTGNDGIAEYSVVTREASENIAYIHSRMPLIFTAENASEYLLGGDVPPPYTDVAAAAAE